MVKKRKHVTITGFQFASGLGTVSCVNPEVLKPVWILSALVNIPGVLCPVLLGNPDNSQMT